MVANALTANLPSSAQRVMVLRTVAFLTRLRHLREIYIAEENR